MKDLKRTKIENNINLHIYKTKESKSLTFYLPYLNAHRDKDKLMICKTIINNNNNRATLLASFTLQERQLSLKLSLAAERHDENFTLMMGQIDMICYIYK